MEAQLPRSVICEGRAARSLAARFNDRLRFDRKQGLGRSLFHDKENCV
jgi:hypothetical protein